MNASSSFFDDAWLQLQAGENSLHSASFSSAFATLRRDFDSFAASVDWRNDGWWIFAVLSLWLQYLLLLLLLRFEQVKVYFALFAANLAVMNLALPLYINPYLNANWRRLGMSAQYFDEDGFFAVMLVGFPLAVIQVFILIKIVFRVFELAADVKRRQLARRRAGGGAGGRRHKVEKCEVELATNCRSSRETDGARDGDDMIADKSGKAEIFASKKVD
eukprot:g10845.t1